MFGGGGGGGGGAPRAITSRILQNCVCADGLLHFLLCLYQKTFPERPGFHYTTNETTTTQKQSDYKVEQSSFTLIALFWLKIGRCRGRNWLNGNQAERLNDTFSF